MGPYTIILRQPKPIGSVNVFGVLLDDLLKFGYSGAGAAFTLKIPGAADKFADVTWAYHFGFTPLDIDGLDGVIVLILPVSHKHF